MKHTTTYRQKDNGWQIIISYKDADGKWRQKSRQGFARKSDAKEAEAELLREIKKAPRPVVQGMADISLIEFTKHYLKHKHALAPGSRRSYMTTVKSLGELAYKPIHQITFMDMQDAVSKWNLKPVTQKNYKARLDIIFRAAIKPYGLISDNPIADIELEKSRIPTKIRTISEEQYGKIIKSLSRFPESRMAVTIGWFTGMRRAEISALTWNDISFADATIAVNKQVAYVDDKKFNVSKTTKSRNGQRVIPIPSELVTALRQYRQDFPINISGNLFRRPMSVYVQLGVLLHKQNVTFHMLRHTYATRLLAKGIDVQTVAALLGDNVQTVISTYIHYTEEMRKAAANSIEKIFATNF